MSTPLASRLALVTGASTGIGRAITLDLARAGAEIIAVALPNTGLDTLATEVAAMGGVIATVELDLKDTAGIESLAHRVASEHGKLDIFVGNAGIAALKTRLADTALHAFTDIISVNVVANFQFIRCLEPLLRKSDAGRAVFTTSSVAHRAPALHGPYSSSKAALDTLVRVWSAELADTNICANLFSPGPVRTQMRTTIIEGEDPNTLPPPEAIAAAMLPMCLPTWTQSGGIYDFRAKVLQRVQSPA
ncbi:SDR family NAD(P)-dependent oxidoreductase [Novosphingobium sp. BL-52-GroH]|uniref:SDR family NAD(P)-dependent oxidoreductase n=1 Tax=Novosphingobium sp. BL-52-GroH TaxID=3349877 RepID=UPI003850D027